MTRLIIPAILILTASGCFHKQRSQDQKPVVTEPSSGTAKIFKQVSGFPAIKDTGQFISDLKKTFDFEAGSPYQQENGKISTYKKVRLYGSDREYILIEYDYGDGPGASFPWKYQLLLTTGGSLVKILSALRFEFIEIFKNENPFLLTLDATSKGNGGHELYKISADTLENVYEGYFDYAVRTYDAHEDNSIYEPAELALKINDFNNDGYNDISFNGKLVLIQGQTKNGDWFDSETIDGKTIRYSVSNPFRKIPVEFVFLYDKPTGHFKAREDYIVKYGLDN